MGTVAAPVISAIRTHFKGITFRSRLEARYAVFFDELGIEWVYEAEGYECDGEMVLPDFFLPGCQGFVEVKPDDSASTYKYWCPVMATKLPLFVVSGMPDNNVSVNEGSGGTVIYYREDEEGGHVWEDWPAFFGECGQCGVIGFGFSGRSDRIDGHKSNCPTRIKHEKYGPDDRLIAAAQKARTYSFWR